VTLPAQSSPSYSADMVIRQSGSNIRVRSAAKGSEHQVTIPAHSPLKVGTLSGILLEIATSLEISKETLGRGLFD